MPVQILEAKNTEKGANKAELSWQIKRAEVSSAVNKLANDLKGATSTDGMKVLFDEEKKKVLKEDKHAVVSLDGVKADDVALNFDGAVANFSKYLNLVSKAVIHRHPELGSVLKDAASMAHEYADNINAVRIRQDHASQFINSLKAARLELKRAG